MEQCLTETLRNVGGWHDAKAKPALRDEEKLPRHWLEAVRVLRRQLLRRQEYNAQVPPPLGGHGELGEVVLCIVSKEVDGLA